MGQRRRAIIGRTDWSIRSALLTFTGAPPRPDPVAGRRADRAEPVRLIDRDRHPVHRQLSDSTRRTTGCAEKGRFSRASSTHGVEGLADSRRNRENDEKRSKPERPVLHAYNPQTPLTLGEV